MGFQSQEKAKPKFRKGLWSPEEDNKLRNYILKNGHGCWTSVPIKAGLERNGKSCRLRWINYLRPGLKRGVFTKHEEDTIMTLHQMLGNKWSQIAQHLSGRTDNEIKNYWHSYLKKKLAKAKEIESDNQIQYATSSSDSTSSQKNSAQDPSYEFSENMDKSTGQFDHTFQQNHNISKEGCQSSLPKLLFAEWLSVDQVINGGNSVNSDDSLLLGNEFYQNSNFQEDILQMSEGQFGQEYQNILIQSSDTEGYNSQFKLSNQVVGNNDIFHLIQGVDLCSNFSLNNDEMYI